MPGPGEYELIKTKVNKQHKSLAFGAKIKDKRFKNEPNEVPGPGEYQLGASSIIIKEAKRESAIYKSNAKRD